MNLAAIRTHFKALLNRSDITDALANTFIDQATARIQRTLRIPSMEKTHSYNISALAGSVVLPNDFLEGIDLSYDNHTLSRLPMGEMLDRKKTGEVGNPHFFTREGGKFLLTPSPSSGTLLLNYYSQFVAMTADSDENNLAAVGSDLIIYGALTYASDYYLDERASLFEQKYTQFMNEIQNQANEAEITGSLQAIRPTYNF